MKDRKSATQELKQSKAVAHIDEYRQVDIENYQPDVNEVLKSLKQLANELESYKDAASAKIDGKPVELEEFFRVVLGETQVELEGIIQDLTLFLTQLNLSEDE